MKIKIRTQIDNKYLMLTNLKYHKFPNSKYIHKNAPIRIRIEPMWRLILIQLSFASEKKIPKE